MSSVDEGPMKKLIKNIFKNSGPSVAKLGPFENGQNGPLYKLKLLQQHQAANLRVALRCMEASVLARRRYLFIEHAIASRGGGAGVNNYEHIVDLY